MDRGDPEWEPVSASSSPAPSRQQLPHVARPRYELYSQEPWVQMSDDALKDVYIYILSVLRSINP